MTPGQKIYFASDFHLGIPNRAETQERERRIVRWLETIEQDAAELYLVGDVFDFWFEYKRAVPKGFTRLLGKLAELSDGGLPIKFFKGNHDMWLFGYLEEEIGVQIISDLEERTINGKRFVIGHGDGLGPGDKGFKFIKKVFRSPVSQWLFARIHPNLGIRIANYWSRKSRLAEGGSIPGYLGDENEWLVQYSKQRLEHEEIDFFIFGHRHLPLDIPLNEQSRYINLGDWIHHNSYAYFDGEDVTLTTFDGTHQSRP